jgi:hypothetical protein
MKCDWRGPGGRVARPRRGAITIVVLVCLVVITAICGVLLRLGLDERRRICAEERRLQAEWLVQSGLERGASRLAAAPGDYRGETWEISAADLGGPDPARVTIAVEPAGEDQGRRHIRVEADYPRDATERARASRRVAVAAGPEGSP